MGVWRLAISGLIGGLIGPLGFAATASACLCGRIAAARCHHGMLARGVMARTPPKPRAERSEDEQNFTQSIARCLNPATFDTHIRERWIEIEE
jgi:hypothetical protein